jgi:hypothetical protein
VQLLLGHRRLESITRCLGVEVEHVQEIAEETDVSWMLGVPGQQPANPGPPV